MTITDQVGLTLTSRQRFVVTQPWDAKTLVTAGAGTGKTTTLTCRLEHLAGAEELTAAEILVLSFSRAAVRELRDRVDRLANHARRVRAQTFDSWALSLLLQGNHRPEDLVSTTFDQRISMAVQAIDNGTVEESEQGVPAHVIIDEVQDLVGVRREMVEALLDRFADDCGFTVVGDAAQSIYGFQVPDRDERAGETNRFLHWVRASFGDDLVEATLQEDFRARTPEARIALPYGARLQNLSPDPDKAHAEATAIHQELRSLLHDTRDFGEVSDLFVQDSLRHFDGTSAILCRDNGQVLLLSEQLHAYGVPHRIQRSPRACPAPTWIAGLLSATGAATLTEERFAQVISTISMPVDVEPTRAWRSLRRVAAEARNQLDLEALRRAVAEGRLPDELTVPPAHPLVLSTVHRAKGLEFDRVLIVEPEALSGRRAHDDDDPPAEARLLYVAMTRPRDDVYRLTRPDTWILRKGSRLPLPIDRWYAGGREPWARNGMEASDLDVCHEVPAGIRETLADPIETQGHLQGCVHPGDEVELRRLHDMPMSPTETPQYGIFHHGRAIGETSETFRGDLWRLLKQSRSFRVEQWPYRITGLRVDALETVTGFTSITERHRLGDRGVWLAPRLCGLGRFDWTHAKRVPEGHLNP